MDQTFEHDPDLASELRQGAGRDWAAEAAEDERLTATHHRRRFDMATVGKEMVNRGDRVTVVYAGHSFSGRVVAGGIDHVTVEGSGQRADIRLDAGYWSILHSTQEATPGTASDETLSARLAEYAELESPVRLTLAEGDMVIGRVTVVAGDHVELTDADERALYVPLGLILGIVRSGDYQ
jgi:hypothetical protein